MLVVAGAVLLAEASAPGAVLTRFCELDSQGAQLTAEGWPKVAALFTAPGTPRRDTLCVVKSYAVAGAAEQDAKATVSVEYIQVGQIDAARGDFSPLPMIKFTADFELVRQESEWKISGPVPAPNLSVEAAVRYVTELRANSKDQTVKKNAGRTLDALKQLKDNAGRPGALPHRR
jgi:hypothetical protein